MGRASALILATGSAPAGLQSPSDLFGANLVHWVDATVAGSMFSNFGHTTPVADTDRIIWWDDQSGSGSHMVADTNHAPIYEAAGFNSGPTPSFDAGPAAERCDLRTGATAVPLNSAALSCFVVLKVGAAANAADRILTFIAGDNPGNEFSANSFILLWGNPGFCGYSGGILGNGGAFTDTPADDTPAVIGFMLDGANAHVYVNGVEIGSATAFTATMGYSGGNQVFLSANSQRTIARMPECVLVNRAATGSEITALQAYLADKHGL